MTSQINLIILFFNWTANTNIHEPSNRLLFQTCRAIKRTFYWYGLPGSVIFKNCRKDSTNTENNLDLYKDKYEFDFHKIK